MGGFFFEARIPRVNKVCYCLLFVAAVVNGKWLPTVDSRLGHNLNYLLLFTVCLFICLYLVYVYCLQTVLRLIINFSKRQVVLKLDWMLRKT